MMCGTRVREEHSRSRWTHVPGHDSQYLDATDGRSRGRVSRHAGRDHPYSRGYEYDRYGQDKVHTKGCDHCGVQAHDSDECVNFRLCSLRLAVSVLTGGVPHPVYVQMCNRLSGDRRRGSSWRSEASHLILPGTDSVCTGSHVMRQAQHMVSVLYDNWTVLALSKGKAIDRQTPDEKFHKTVRNLKEPLVHFVEQGLSTDPNLHSCVPFSMSYFHSPIVFAACFVGSLDLVKLLHKSGAASEHDLFVAKQWLSILGPDACYSTRAIKAYVDKAASSPRSLQDLSGLTVSQAIGVGTRWERKEKMAALIFPKQLKELVLFKDVLKEFQDFQGTS